MSKDNQDDLSEERKSSARLPGPGLVVPLLILALIAGYLFVLSNGPKRITSQQFFDQLRAKNVAEVELFSRYAVGKFKELPKSPAGSKAEQKGDKTSEPAAEQPAKEKSQEKGKVAKRGDREA